MFTDVGEYIKLTREERQSHLDMSEPCILIGGHSSTVFKGLLAHHLKTTIPTRQKIYLCHACNNARCSNVKHLYWGTPHDNYVDSRDVLFGSRNHGYSAKCVANAKAMGHKYGGRNKLSKEKIDVIMNAINAEPKTWGWKTRVAKTLRVSTTQINRYIKLLP